MVRTPRPYASDSFTLKSLSSVCSGWKTINMPLRLLPRRSLMKHSLSTWEHAAAGHRAGCQECSRSEADFPARELPWLHLPRVAETNMDAPVFTLKLHCLHWSCFQISPGSPSFLLPGLRAPGFAPSQLCMHVSDTAVKPLFALFLGTHGAPVVHCECPCPRRGWRCG